LTRIKAISVVAAALMLTALGASSGFAWNGVTLSAEVVCKDSSVLVHALDNDSHDLKNHSPGTLSVIDAKGAVVLSSAPWTFGSGTDVIARIDTLKLHGPGPFQIELDEDASVKSAPFTVNCKPAACSEQLTFPANAPTSDGTNVTWTIHNSTNSPITFVWFIKEASAHPTLKQGTAPANGDDTFDTPLVKDSLTDTLYLSWGGAQACAAKKVFTVSSSPATSPSATATATAEPSATASPSESAAAAASAVPSPPNTGGGPSGTADRSFAFVLLALVLGTVGVGGTTLALSRKGS
jgi:hypothetical protein